MLLEYLEGLKLTSYPDQAGVWTIGYGHTEGVSEGQTITPEQALSDLHQTCQSLVGMVPDTLGQNAYDACLCMAYNVGVYGWVNSTLCGVLRAKGPMAVTRNLFTRWNKIKDPQSGLLVVSPGLNRRRNLEYMLFTTADDAPVDLSVIGGWDVPQLLMM